MERREVIESLLKIEESLPVNEWRYGDMQLWPYIKTRLFFTAFNQGTNAFSANRTQAPSMGLRMINSMTEHIRIKYVLKGKTTLLAGAPIYRTAYKGRYVNKFFEPLFNNDPNSVYLESGIKKTGLPYNGTIIEAYKLFDIYRLKNKLFPIKEELKLNGWEQLSKISPTLIHSTKLNKDEINLMGRNLRFMASVYEEILKRTSIKIIYSLCYYNSEMIALHYTANKMGIVNIDLQHGGIGYLHALYTYRNFPKDGFNTLPQHFFTWDDVSKKHIESWLPKNNYHTVQTFGNPWLKFIVEHEQDEIKEKRKIILYTLQFDEIDEYIFDAVKLTDDNYIWWFRLHPRMSVESEKIEKQIEQHELQNKINLDEANVLPLPLILKNCFIHISKYSGSIIEAEQFNKKSIVLEATGIELYKEYIESGNSVGLPSPTGEKIWEIIKNNQQ